MKNETIRKQLRRAGFDVKPLKIEQQGASLVVSGFTDRRDADDVANTLRFNARDVSVHHIGTRSLVLLEGPTGAQQ